MTDPEAVLVVIPVHNRWQKTYACLHSLSGHCPRGFQMLVVDAGSSDGTKELLPGHFPKVAYLPGEAHWFWARAIEEGVKWGLERDFRQFILLNNDTVCPEGFLEKMHRFHQQHPYALHTCLFQSLQQGQLYYPGVQVVWATHWYRSPQQNQWAGFRPNHLPGRALWVPAEVFRLKGVMDTERLPHYLADYDLTCQAAKNGFALLVDRTNTVGFDPKASNDYRIRQQKNWSGYREHLFGMKGAGNLLFFMRYALRNCPVGWLPFFLVIGSVKRIIGYWL
jgi:GT2 family glycosyltransferase